MPTTKTTFVITASLETAISFSGISLLDTTVAPVNEQLNVYHTPISTGVQVTLTFTTDYTVNTGTSTVNLTFTPSAGDLITIERYTNREERYTDFTGLSNLRSDDVDFDSDQLFHILQELTTAYGDALIKTTDGTAWAGQGLPSQNCAPAVASSGWPTLAQVQDLIAGLGTASVENVTEWFFDGTGSATDFTLTDAPAGLEDPRELFVVVNNVIQTGDSDGYSYVGSYDIDTTGTHPVIQFASAPSAGTKNIHVRAISGTVSTTFSDRSVTADAIALNSISGEHLVVDAGVAKRFWVFNSSGQPENENGVTISTSYLSDWPGALSSVPLNTIGIPTSAMNFNSQQLTGITAGSGPSHAVNKGQMDAAIAAAGGFNASAYSPVALSSVGTNYTHASSNAAFVICRKTFSGSHVSISVSHDSNPANYVTITVIGYSNAGASASFFVPAGGMYKFENSNPDEVYIQTFS